MNTDDIVAIIRHVLTSAGGGLVTAGYLTADELSGAVGAIAVLIGIGWSLYNKWQHRQAIAAVASGGGGTVIVRQEGKP